MPVSGVSAGSYRGRDGDGDVELLHALLELDARIALLVECEQLRHLTPPPEVLAARGHSLIRTSSIRTYTMSDRRRRVNPRSRGYLALVIRLCRVGDDGYHGRQQLSASPDGTWRGHAGPARRGDHRLDRPGRSRRRVHREDHPPRRRLPGARAALLRRQEQPARRGLPEARPGLPRDAGHAPHRSARQRQGRGAQAADEHPAHVRAARARARPPVRVVRVLGARPQRAARSSSSTTSCTRRSWSTSAARSPTSPHGVA